MTTPTRPLSPRIATCRVCSADIVWALTLAGPNGPGGRRMPLDALPNDAGNVAVQVRAGGSLVARVLGKDDTIDRSTEQLAMPHFASCGGRRLVSEVEAFLRGQEASS